MKGTKAPRLTLASNPSIPPTQQGVTLEPLDPDTPALHRLAEWVRVAPSTRPGNIVLTGYTHLDAEGKSTNAIIRVDVPEVFIGDGINWIAATLDTIGVTDDRPAFGRLGVVRGGLTS